MEYAMDLRAGRYRAETAPFDWQIFVACQNEAARIAGCLASIRAAIGDRRALVTLNVNGCTDDSAAAAQRTARDHGLNLRLYRTQAGDKANAINQFIYSLRVPARMYVFVDGYVWIRPGALQGLEACLAANPLAVATTGVALNGRTMRLHTHAALARGGVLHGGLHALRPEFLDRMVAQGIRLPIGTYFVDGLVGSMAAHDLDATGREWDNGRIVGVRDAAFEIQSLSLFKPRDLKRQFRRKVRQVRGRLQNAAIKEVIYRHGYAGLPADADDLVREHLAKHGAPTVRLLDRPFMELALWQIRAARKTDPADYVPRLVRVPEHWDPSLAPVPQPAIELAA